MTALARASASDRASSPSLEPAASSPRDPRAPGGDAGEGAAPIAPDRPSVVPDPKPETRAGAEVSRETFRPTDRVKRRADFRRVQSAGRKIHTPHYVVAVLPRPEGGPTRLGITVTRKVAGAVGRNRVKRVMREVFRRNRELFPPACDVVVIAKEGAPSLGYPDALAELEGVRRGLASAHLPRAARGGSGSHGRGRS